jgi:hypothetical protein
VLTQLAPLHRFHAQAAQAAVAVSAAPRIAEPPLREAFPPVTFGEARVIAAPGAAPLAFPCPPPPQPVAAAPPAVALPPFPPPAVAIAAPPTVAVAAAPRAVADAGSAPEPAVAECAPQALAEASLAKSLAGGRTWPTVAGAQPCQSLSAGQPGGLARPRAAGAACGGGPRGCGGTREARAHPPP